MTETKRLRLRVTGVPCATCIIPIRRALEKADGVKKIGANYAADLIIVEYDSSTTTEQQIIKLVKKTGYRATPYHI
ncbi:MAG: heavy-metal-associated domain-containing protein [Thaumarchaeota archaeon]|nr:heavy-metal-associated domain-containing protein [Nitrososphaerota archaeon]